jgi:hypothetical protein
MINACICTCECGCDVHALKGVGILVSSRRERLELDSMCTSMLDQCAIAHICARGVGTRELRQVGFYSGAGTDARETHAHTWRSAGGLGEQRVRGSKSCRSIGWTTWPRPTASRRTAMPWPGTCFSTEKRASRWAADTVCKQRVVVYQLGWLAR